MKTPRRTGLTDTHPEIDAMLADGFRRMGAAEKFALVDSLSSAVIANAKRAIREANPGLDQHELDLIFLEKHYGRDLAERFRKYSSEQVPS